MTRRAQLARQASGRHLQLNVRTTFCAVGGGFRGETACYGNQRREDRPASHDVYTSYTMLSVGKELTRIYYDREKGGNEAGCLAKHRARKKQLSMA
jgi:hypothetical protein